MHRLSEPCLHVAIVAVSFVDEEFIVVEQHQNVVGDVGRREAHEAHQSVRAVEDLSDDVAELGSSANYQDERWILGVELVSGVVGAEDVLAVNSAEAIGALAANVGLRVLQPS